MKIMKIEKKKTVSNHALKKNTEKNRKFYRKMSPTW